jgi:hypothetical protein
MKWVKKLGLKAQDELDVTETGTKLIIDSLKEEAEPQEKTITINIDTLTVNLLRRYINTLYCNGYTNITLTYKKKTIFDNHTQKEEPLLQLLQSVVTQGIGMTITHQDNEKTIFKIVAESNKEEIDNSIQQAFSILTYMTEEIIDSINEGKKEPLDFLLNFSEPNLNVATVYSQKILNRYGKENNIKSHNYFLLTAQLEELGDNIVKIIRIIKENPTKNKDTIPLMKQINETISQMRNLIKNYTLEKAAEVYKQKYKNKEDIQKIKDQKIQNTITTIQDQLTEILHTIISIKTE